MTISNYQLKQVRLLENQAKHDSLKVIKLNIAVDTLNRIIELKDKRINNYDSIFKLQNEKTELQTVLIENRKEELSMSFAESSLLTSKLRKRNLIIIISAILNTVFIIKAIN